MGSMLDRLQAEAAEPAFVGLHLAQLKMLGQGVKPHLVFLLKRYEGGYALRFELRRTFGFPVGGWYLAERSREVRRFATVEAALSVARELGLAELRVEVGG